MRIYNPFRNTKNLLIPKPTIERQLIDKEYELNKYKIIAQEYCPHLQMFEINKPSYTTWENFKQTIHPNKIYNECLCCGKRTEIE